MASFRFILAATDFSPEGNNAVWRAAAMSQQLGARMGIVHIVDPAGYQPLRDWMLPSYQLDMMEARALAQVRQLAIDVAHCHGLTPSIVVQEGDVGQKVARAAATADLLVIGRPGRRKLRDLLTVRTADRILRASRRPVLVARNPVKGPYTKVLVPVDFSACSDAALRAARRLAPELTLGLFHAIDPANKTITPEAEVPAWVVREVRAREDAGTLARMRRQVTRLGLDHRAMQFAVGRGRTVLATARHALQQDAELMVITRAGRWSLSEFLPANVSNRLLKSSSCDVLLLPRLADAEAASHVTVEPTPLTMAMRDRGSRSAPRGLPAGAGASLRNDSRFNWLARP
ncbi:MAG: universal stress protein [Burkholderiaceae bacterium]